VTGGERARRDAGGETLVGLEGGGEVERLHVSWSSRECERCLRTSLPELRLEREARGEMKPKARSLFGRDFLLFLVDSRLRGVFGDLRTRITGADAFLPVSRRCGLRGTQSVG
jgi:hypothetical protein